MNRPGISLLEVLFAMLVGTIGLLGAISLLPVAIEQANKGREADAQMIFGESAIEEFKVRALYLPERWVIHNGIHFINFNGQLGMWQYSDGSKTYLYNSSTGKWKAGDGTDGSSGPAPTQNSSFCIDPLGVANYLPTNSAYISYPYGRGSVSVFPGTSGNGPGMPVMYRAGMSQMYNNSGVLSFGPSSSGFVSVTPQFAETACFSHDEVNLFRPKTATDPISLVYETNTSKPMNMRPQVVPDQQYSWFATMSPKVDGQSDEYLLSVAVCHRRPLPPTTPDTLSERVVGITLYDGVTGGDATLDGASLDEVAVQSGNWILLVGTHSTAGGTGANPNDEYARFFWYRVVQTADATQNSATNASRDVTLFGPDWNIPSGDFDSSRPRFKNTTRTYAVIMTDVKAVYERTIRVQRSSLW